MREKKKIKKMEWETPVLTNLSRGAWSSGACEDGSGDANECIDGAYVRKK